MKNLRMFNLACLNFLDNKKDSNTGVILLHGFGADMHDLFSMWKTYLTKQEL